MLPVVKELQKEYDIVIVDADKYPTLIKKYNITKFPTLWVDGTKYEGVRTKKQYREYMNNDS